MNLNSEVNVLTSIEQALYPYRSKPVYFEPLGGNNGDTLIEKGALSYFKSLDIKLARKPENSEAIVINGGGAMNDIWKSGIFAVEKYSFQYPDIPLIILPSSFKFQETNFPSLLSKHKAPVIIFAREPYSLIVLQNLEFLPNVQLGIDHDMAFRLKKTAFIQNLKSSSINKHVLIVERHDFESTTTLSSELTTCQESQRQSCIKDPMPPEIRKYFDKYLRNPLRHRFLRNREQMNINSNFTKSAYRQVLADYPEVKYLPIYAADISSNYNFSYKQFTRIIAESAVIVTTRLHVGILAAMLNKPTYLKAGNYHKIRGVFEYSLTNKDHFHLMD